MAPKWGSVADFDLYAVFSVYAPLSSGCLGHTAPLFITYFGSLFLAAMLGGGGCHGFQVRLGPRLLPYGILQIG